MRFEGVGLSPDGNKAFKGQTTRKQDILVFQPVSYTHLTLPTN